MHRLIASLFTFLLGLSLLSSGAALQAQTLSASSPTPLRTDDWELLMDLSSLGALLKELPNHLKQGVAYHRAQGAPIAPEVETALAAAADETYRLDRLRDMAKAHLQSSLSPEQLAQWLAFYRSPLGQKLAQAQARGSTPEFQRSIMTQGPQLIEKLSADTPRLALIQSGLQATDAVEQATRMALQTQLALEWGLIATMPPSPDKPSFRQLQEHFEGQRFAVRAQMAQVLLAHWGVAYQDFSNAELAQLLSLSNAPAGKALHIDFSRKFYQTLVALAEQTGQVAARRLAQRPA